MSKPAWTIGARTGPVRDYLQLKVFACEGLICVIDERPGQTEGEYCVLTPADLEERVKALNKMYRGQTRADLTKWQQQEHDQRVRGSQNCMETIKEARHMGDPSDPAVQAFWARHRRSSTVKISFSPGCDPAGYPELPVVPLGKKTGRTARIDGEAVVPPNINPNAGVTKIHRGPRKKNRQGLITLD